MNKTDQIQNKNKNEEHEKHRKPTQQRETRYGQTEGIYI